MTATGSAERLRVSGFGRLDLGLRQASDWYLWGPHLSERQWGTVREDYSAGGDAWNYLPDDHARSRPCRWGEWQPRWALPGPSTVSATWAGDAPRTPNIVRRHHVAAKGTGRCGSRFGAVGVARCWDEQ